MNDSWLEISCDVPVEYSDEVADYIGYLTSNGVCVDNIYTDAFSVNEIPQSARVIVKGYVSSDINHLEVMNSIISYINDMRLQHTGSSFIDPVINTVKTEDWSNSWKVHFKPLRVGKRLLIVPTWENAECNFNDLVIRIDPGMAFGTGGHETTRLCLHLLEEVMESTPLAGSPSLLDLGTGSGILAMAASLLGAGHILAVDIDPDAIVVARENLELNSLSNEIECDTVQLENISDTFEIILANILAEELVRLSVSLFDRLENGGHLILSGILAEKESYVFNGFKPTGLTFCKTVRDGEWIAMLYKKESVI